MIWSNGFFGSPRRAESDGVHDDESSYLDWMKRNPRKNFLDYAIENQLEVQVWANNSYPLLGTIIAYDRETLSVKLKGDGISVVNRATWGNIRWPVKTRNNRGKRVSSGSEERR